MFIKEPWFWRGAQSALFYYVSCAPCTRIAFLRKQRKEQRKAKADKEKEMAEAGPSNLYPEHPLPSGTNPYWREEMVLGPGPPPKRRKKEDEGRLIEMQPSGSGVVSSSGSKETSSDTMAVNQGSLEVPHESRNSDEGWNKQRYQREDELLWGLDDTMSQSTAMDSLSHSNSRGHHYYARNPAVNDLHPPVVSTAPTSRAEIQWMIQPPPKAKIMEGKEKANRSRSGSGGSYGSRGSSTRRTVGEPGLGRQLSERLVETKLRHGDQPGSVPLTSASMSRSRGSSNQSQVSRTTSAQGQRHDRDRGGSNAKISVESLTRHDRKTAPASLSLETDGASVVPPSTPQPTPGPAQPTRPPLATIPSTSLVPHGRESSASRSSTPAAARNLIPISSNNANSVQRRPDINLQPATPKSPPILKDIDLNPQPPFSSSRKSAHNYNSSDDDDDDVSRTGIIRAPLADQIFPTKTTASTSTGERSKRWTGSPSDFSTSTTGTGAGRHKTVTTLDGTFSSSRDENQKDFLNSADGMDIGGTEDDVDGERGTGAMGHRHRWSMYI